MVVGGGGEIDVGREGPVGIRLRVLLVRPSDAEVCALGVIPGDAVTALRLEVGGVDRSAVPVTPAVGGSSSKPPRALGVEISCQLEVYMVIECQVISAVA